jgi:hypothetical protein
MFTDRFPVLAWQDYVAAELATDAFAFLFPLLIIFLQIVMIALGIMNLYYNLRAFGKLPPQFRKMESYQVLFLLIPCFNVIESFFLFTKVPASLQTYFYQTGRLCVSATAGLSPTCGWRSVRYFVPLRYWCCCRCT